MAGNPLLAPLHRWLARRARARARLAAQAAQDGGETVETGVDWLRWAGRLAWPLGLAAVLLAGLWSMNHPVQRVRIEGTFQRVRANDVERVVRQNLGRFRRCRSGCVPRATLHPIGFVSDLSSRGRKRDEFSCRQN